jgi:hypothetical protein
MFTLIILLNRLERTEYRLPYFEKCVRRGKLFANKTYFRSLCITCMTGKERRIKAGSTCPAVCKCAKTEYVICDWLWKFKSFLI